MSPGRAGKTIPDLDTPRLDAVTNHLIGVQVFHRQLITSDIAEVARCKAGVFGCRASQTGS